MNRWGAAAIALLLALVTLSLHVWSLADGTVLDDYWHQRGLSTHGWSPGELMRSLEIEPADFTNFWWQERTVRWDYGRPLFILAMKFVYVTLGGEDPFALHLFSLLLHLVSVWLVAHIAWRLTGLAAAALLSGGVFAIYPHSVITVAWPSSQNAVLVTTMMLAAWLAYWRATRAFAREEPAAAGGARYGAWASVYVLWVAALFVRENALMLPALLLLLDHAAGEWARLRARLPAYAAFAVIGAAFIAWRLLAVSAPMPDVYVRRPEGDWAVYGGWLLAKLLHYLASSIWLAPMTIGPTGRINPWAEAPGDCWLMVAIVVLIGGGYLWHTRGVRGAWSCAAWIVLAVVPVVPVIATPHSGYIPGVGVALGLAFVLAAARRAPAWWDRVSPRVLVPLYVCGLAVMSLFNRWQWTGMIAAERYALEHIEAAPPEPAVTDVFLINVPFVNIYAKPALDRRIGGDFADKRLHVLCYAPEPLLVNTDCIVEPVDEHTLRVSAVQRPFFERLLGRFLLEAFRGRPLVAGEVIAGEAFDTRIASVDERGVWTLEFTFAHCLSDPRYAFYLATPWAGAARVRFDERNIAPVAQDAASVQVARLLGGDARHVAGALERAAAGERLEPEAHEALLAVTRCVAGALGDPAFVGLCSAEPERAAWERASGFWRERVDQGTVDRTWNQWPLDTPLIKLRNELPHARMWAGRVIRTDLYLTGRPFAGPAAGE